MNESRFSVIVPTFARPDRLSHCLASLAQLDFPRDRFEVIVVDDGSPAPAHAVAAPYAARLDLTVIRQDNAGPAAARNAGARAAKYEMLAFTDDDCQPHPGWLRAFALAVADQPEALLGGATRNALTANVYARASQSIVDYLYAYYGASQGAAPFFTSNNMAAERQRFLRLGGFDETFPLAAAEDREFGLRWRRREGPLRFVEDAVIDHAHALTLRRFARQHANYGRGARHLAHVLHDAGERHRIEPARFYLGLLLHPFQYGPALVAAAESLLIVLSQIAMTWGYAQEWRHENHGRATRARFPINVS